MPLARIIGEVTQDSRCLLEALLSRGFEVQIVPHTRESSIPVDLEINLRRCTPEDALSQIFALADQDVSVFLSPGAMTPSASAPAIETERTVEPEPVQASAMPEPNFAAELGAPLQLVDVWPEPLPEIAEPPILPASPENDQPAQLVPIPARAAAGSRRRKAQFAEIRAAAKHLAEHFRGVSVHVSSLEQHFVASASITAGAAVLVLALIAFTHRFSPLPRQILQNSSQGSQPTPFQKSRPEIPGASAETIAPASSPPMQMISSPSAHPDAVQITGPVEPTQQVHRLSWPVSDEGDVIAQDSVIRYRQPTPSATQTEKKQSGIKHYSDLESD